MKPTIITHHGLEFDLLNPDPDLIEIEDIAHALSHLCRFTGHTNVFYSVASHSYQASFLVPPEHAMEALLHDAAEAYVGDVSSPLKSLLPEYRMIEFRIDQAVRQRFDLPAKMTPCVKNADLRRLATEKEQLIPMCEPWDILQGIEPDPMYCMTSVEPRMAYIMFMTRFDELQKKRVAA